MDVVEEKRTMELLRASENRYRLITDNVADVIWTSQFAVNELAAIAADGDIAAVVDAILAKWRFSFVSPAVEHVLGYTPEETKRLSLLDVAAPASHSRIRDAMIEEFSRPPDPTGTFRRHVLELEFLAKDGSYRWCEVVSTYLRDDAGTPISMLGITRDISQRRKAEQALRDSENRLRSLLENLPDFVLVVDRDAIIRFANRDSPGGSKESLLGASLLDFHIPEHREACRDTLAQAFATRLPQSCQSQDVDGHWWAIQVVALEPENGVEQALVICTDITVERVTAEAVKKEQRLLRRLLELHERERQLTAYEIHDGFAQQLTGAMYRLQGFREHFAKNSTEAWKNFDSAAQLLSHAIDETRRLISGLRPPILDESGIVEAIQYLIYEHRQHGGPEIEFEHDVSFSRLAPPLESAVFRIVQESLQNACRHSKSDRVSVSLVQCNDRIHIDVQDWGIGFDPNAVAEQRFGLQGVRERVRLLDGNVTIQSARTQGTLISVELPLVEASGGSPAQSVQWD